MDTPAEDTHKYEGDTRCNACGSTALDVTVIGQIDSYVCESHIKCNLCWFEDYWAYGHLESVSEIGRNKCDTY